MKNIIIKTPHSEDCFLKNEGREYYLPAFVSSRLSQSEEPIFHGNFAGNKTRRGWYAFLVMICNNPDCHYRALIRTDFIAEMLKNP